MKKLVFTLKIKFDKEPDETNDETFERFKKVMSSLGLEWDVEEYLGVMDDV